MSQDSGIPRSINLQLFGDDGHSDFADAILPAGDGEDDGADYDGDDDPDQEPDEDGDPEDGIIDDNGDGDPEGNPEGDDPQNQAGNLQQRYLDSQRFITTLQNENAGLRGQMAQIQQQLPAMVQQAAMQLLQQYMPQMQAQQAQMQQQPQQQQVPEFNEEQFWQNPQAAVTSMAQHIASQMMAQKEQQLGQLLAPVYSFMAQQQQMQTQQAQIQQAAQAEAQQKQSITTQLNWLSENRQDFQEVYPVLQQMFVRPEFAPYLSQPGGIFGLYTMAQTVAGQTGQTQQQQQQKQTGNKRMAATMRGSGGRFISQRQSDEQAFLDEMFPSSNKQRYKR